MKSWSSNCCLSVVIPALNAAERLKACLDSIAGARHGGLVGEVIVVDGGSTDDTLAVARQVGAKVLSTEPGRGGQLAEGGASAGGDWILFLHGDTVLVPGWEKAAADFIADTGNLGRAAVFRFALDDRGAAARRLERFVSWRCRLFALPYGDQGLLISRAFYESLGGFEPLPIMEDVELVRRIGRTRLSVLDCPAITSAARYRKSGYVGRSLRNLGCLALYFLGAPPRLLTRLYG